ncbi:MAG: UvrD-helicase domain-containing protein [Lentisphaeria bacterium]
MSGLNSQQQLAIDTLSGPILLLAGAGTGKTTVIVHRVANLVRHGVRPDAILAVTFTNKAAREMRNRVKDLLGSLAETMTICTFHAFCAGILRRQIKRLGYSCSFSIASDSYQNGLIREIMTQEGMTATGFDPCFILHQISLAKAALLSPEQIRQRNQPKDVQLALLYQKYQLRLQQMDMLDFDDMLFLTVRLWQQVPEILATYQQKYSHLMIDEYQDTNAAQLQIMLMLSATTSNIAVVGDDDQSIYGWRGADMGNILQFESFFPNAKVIRLEQNYRSTNTILRSANAVIAKNQTRREKNLWSDQGDGEKILGVRCADEKTEADFIVKYIQSQIPESTWRDFAVLFRSNHQARVLEEQFRKSKLPYVLVGANSFYQNKEILDAISFLQLIQNPADDFSFLRVVNVPPRGIGDTSIARLREFRDITQQNFNALLKNQRILEKLPEDSAKNLNQFLELLQQTRTEFQRPGQLYQKATAFFQKIDYFAGLGRMYKPREDALRRRDNLLEFMNSLADFDADHRGQGTLQEFLESFALQEHSEKKEKKENATDSVTMMTVHSAKGLEFPTVLVAGLERNIFPHQRAVEEGHEEEERRLFYVALTRARKNVLLCYAEKRRVMGKVSVVRPSKFLAEIPEEYIVFTTPEKAIKPLSREETQQYFQDMIQMLSLDQEE